MEITTGMSPPPIGSTNSAPRSSDTAKRAHSPAAPEVPITIEAPSAKIASRSSPLRSLCSGNCKGLPESSSWSFPNAMMLPVNDTAPITVPSTIEVVSPAPAFSAVRAMRMYSATETRAAVAPPIPLNSATICGMAVICTVRAKYVPIAAPITVPTPIIQNDSICLSSRVAARASAIPNAASWFPERAVPGELRRLSPKMKRTAEMMYAAAITDSRSSPITLLRVALAEHLEHSVGHDEAAEYVCGPEHDSDEAKRLEEQRVGRPRHQHRAQHDDSMYCVRGRHQRGVQHGRDASDYLEADEHRKGEHVNAQHDFGRHATASVARFLIAAFLISPFAVTQTASMMSSLMSSLRLPSEVISVTRAATFLAYIWLA